VIYLIFVISMILKNPVNHFNQWFRQKRLPRFARNDSRRIFFKWNEFIFQKITVYL